MVQQCIFDPFFPELWSSIFDPSIVDGNKKKVSTNLQYFQCYEGKSTVKNEALLLHCPLKRWLWGGFLSLLGPVSGILFLHFGGGNPGPADAGGVVRGREDRILGTYFRFLGEGRNHQAKIQTHVEGIKLHLNCGIQSIKIVGNSKLIIDLLLNKTRESSWFIQKKN